MPQSWKLRFVWALQVKFEFWIFFWKFSARSLYKIEGTNKAEIFDFLLCDFFYSVSAALLFWLEFVFSPLTEKVFLSQTSLHSLNLFAAIISSPSSVERRAALKIKAFPRLLYSFFYSFFFLFCIFNIVSPPPISLRLFTLFSNFLLLLPHVCLFVFFALLLPFVVDVLCKYVVNVRFLFWRVFSRPFPLWNAFPAFVRPVLPSRFVLFFLRFGSFFDRNPSFFNCCWATWAYVFDFDCVRLVKKKS